MRNTLRIAIVGSSSLLGKELVDVLAESSLGVVDLVLLDEEVQTGQITAAGDEPAVIHRIESGSFNGVDLCFFAGSAEETRRHWQQALQASALAVDLTNALAGQDTAEVWAPWVKRATLKPTTKALIPAHPVAVMLALVAERCRSLGLAAIAATVLEPASERGTAGVDEMHQQTVSLLSFQSLPRAEFDAQVAFNLLPRLGPAARVAMHSTARRIQADAVAAIGDGPRLTLQVVHAPVFHGYGLSLVLDFADPVHARTLQAALAGEHTELVPEEEDAPSNASAAGQGTLLIQVPQGEGNRLWLWLVADNLKIAALQAVACGAHLLGPRARTRLQ